MLAFLLLLLLLGGLFCFVFVSLLLQNALRSARMNIPGDFATL